MSKFAHFPIKRSLQGDRTNDSRARKYKTPVPDQLQNHIYQYIASLEIGTPAQTSEAAIDTGSSDLWVLASSSGTSSGLDTSSGSGTTSGSGTVDTYDPEKSSTYKFLNDQFSIQYVSGAAQGDWVTDNVAFGSDETFSLQFATVTNNATGTETSGIFGIGQASNESSVVYGNTAAGGEYLNFPAALKEQGKIGSIAYSLWLNSVTSTDSSITFGGVDTSKYTGSLYQIPFTKTNEFSVDFEVAGYTSNGVLDSGTSLTYLNKEIADAVAEKYGAEYVTSGAQGLYVITSEPKSQEPLVYTFGKAKIEVPVSELFLTVNGSKILSILTTESSEGVTLLGDSFLRSAYVVYNLEGNIGAIAQSNWSPGKSEIVDIVGSTIPGAVE